MAFFEMSKDLAFLWGPGLGSWVTAVPLEHGWLGHPGPYLSFFTQLCTWQITSSSWPCHLWYRALLPRWSQRSKNYRKPWFGSAYPTAADTEQQLYITWREKITNPSICKTTTLHTVSQSKLSISQMRQLRPEKSKSNIEDWRVNVTAPCWEIHSLHFHPDALSTSHGWLKLHHHQRAQAIQPGRGWSQRLINTADTADGNEVAGVMNPSVPIACLHHIGFLVYVQLKTV